MNTVQALRDLAVDQSIKELLADREALAKHWAPIKYFDNFSSYESMTSQWNGSTAVRDDEVIFATYNCPPYEGYAICVYKRAGKLFEVHDSHCSCNGLDNWEPEETTFAAIRMRKVTPEIEALLAKAEAA